MISVVIPTHNRCNLLKRAVDSVLNQTYKDIELIVVSDGSTDETDAVMQKYTNNDDRVRFIHYPDPKGANHARNTGIKESRGNFIAFLDDDDEWFPQKLEKQIRVFNEDGEIGLVYSGIDVIQQDSGTHYLSIPNEEGALKKKILLWNCITTTSTVVLKRSILEEVGCFDEQLPAKQDYDLWIRCLQITKVGCVSEPLINYYVSSNSNQISSHLDRYVKATEIIDEKYKDLITLLTDDECKIRDAIKFQDLAKIALKNNKKRECRSFSRKSLQCKMRIETILLYFSSFLNYSFVMRILQKMRK